MFRNAHLFAMIEGIELAERMAWNRKVLDNKPKLESAERRIKEGVRVTMEALHDIERGELWRYSDEKFESMNDYTAKKLGFGIRRRQQLAHAENVRLELADIVTTPEARTFVQDMREGHVRALEIVPVDNRAEVIEEAVKTPGKVTAPKLLAVASQR